MRLAPKAAAASTSADAVDEGMSAVAIDAKIREMKRTIANPV